MISEVCEFIQNAFVRAVVEVLMNVAVWTIALYGLTVM